MRKDILIKVNTKTSRIDLPTDFIGITGENLQGKLKFQLDNFIDGVGVLLIHQEYESSSLGEIENHDYFVELEKEDNLYTLDIKDSLLKGWKVDLQLKITEPENESGVPVFKSNKFFLKVEQTIAGDTEIPDEYPSWLDTANAKIIEMDEKIAELDEDVASGRFNGESVVDAQINENGELILTIDKVVE